SHTRAASPPFLAAPTCTRIPALGPASNSPEPSWQITSWLCAWQTLLVRQINENSRSAARRNRKRAGKEGARFEEEKDEVRGFLHAPRVWQIFAMGMGSNSGLCFQRVMRFTRISRDGFPGAALRPS